MFRDEEAFEATVDLLRQAALGQASWEAALAAVGQAGGGRGNLVGVSGGLMQFCWANDIDPGMWDEFGESLNSEQLNPRLKLGSRTGVMERVEGYDFASDEFLRRYPVYGEVCRRYDVGGGTQMLLDRTGDEYVGLAILRGSREPHGGPGDGEAVDAIAPYVLDAVRLRRMIEEQGALIAQNALEAMRTAAFLCDGWGRVRRLTPSAEVLVAPGGPIALKNGYITLRTDEATRQLLEAIETAVRRPLTPVRMLPADGLGGGRIILEAAALPPLPGSLGFAPRAIVAVRRRRLPPKPALVAAVYALTQAEAEVACALARGDSRDEVAATRGVSVETIRSQLKLIFGKMGVSREAEMVARLYEIA